MQWNMRQAAREWLVALSAYALLVAPFGCELQSGLINGPTGGGNNLNTSSAGLFLNEDTTDPLIVAGRNASGDAFYVFGTRQNNGAVGEVNSILLKMADGREALIVFELGRPVYLEGPDGSYIKIVYTEVSAQRLTAAVTIYDAGTRTTQTENVEVDLQRTAEQVAQFVEELTGQKLDVPVAPPATTAKWEQRALGPLLRALVVIPMIVLTQMLVVIVGQIMAEVFVAVTKAMQVAVVAACAPLFMFAGLLGEVTVEVSAVPLVDIFVELPSPPVIDIVIG